MSDKDHHNKCCIAQVRKPAPTFKANSFYKGGFKEISLKDYGGKWVILFFWPLDFTFVCPTEIIAFSNKAQEFLDNGANLLGCSIDSVFSHMEWAKKSRKEGGLGEMNFPMLSDIDKSIARSYGCLIEDGPDFGVAFRATYIIDPKGQLRHISISDLPIGRNPDEVINS
jgi:alkyl hydroperoxide reductase subunit AhpC